MVLHFFGYSSSTSSSDGRRCSFSYLRLHSTRRQARWRATERTPTVVRDGRLGLGRGASFAHRRAAPGVARRIPCIRGATGFWVPVLRPGPRLHVCAHERGFLPTAGFAACPNKAREPAAATSPNGPRAALLELSPGRASFVGRARGFLRGRLRRPLKPAVARLDGPRSNTNDGPGRTSQRGRRRRHATRDVY